MKILQQPCFLYQAPRFFNRKIFWGRALRRQRLTVQKAFTHIYDEDSGGMPNSLLNWVLITLRRDLCAGEKLRPDLRGNWGDPRTLIIYVCKSIIWKRLACRSYCSVNIRLNQSYFASHHVSRVVENECKDFDTSKLQVTMTHKPNIPVNSYLLPSTGKQVKR